jgi:hypothetical protein
MAQRGRRVREPRLKRRPESGLKKQLLALKNRVSYLERALRPARQKASREDLADRLDHAKEDARSQALKEYYAQRRLKGLGQNDLLLEIEQVNLDERNAFLRSRGLPPERSQIPKELRKKARRLAAEWRRKHG